MDAARRWYVSHRKLVVAIVGAVLTVAIQAFGTSNPYVSFGGPGRHVAGRVRRPQPGPAARSGPRRP